MWEVSPSTQGWPDPSPLQLVVSPSPPPPQVERVWMGIRKGSGCLCPIPLTVSNPPCPYTSTTLW